jgi:membrane-associated phospholipid phosphatase
LPGWNQGGHLVHPAIEQWDLGLLLWVRSWDSQLAVWAAWLVASLSWKGVTWWILAAVFWAAGRRRLAAQFALALFTGTLAIIALKGVVSRPRPDLYAAQQLNIPHTELLPTLHSFPSGHTLLAAAIMVVLLSRYRDWRAWSAAMFAGLVGLARVYQGMHWPTDIIGSVILGMVAGAAALQLSNLPLLKRWTTKGKAMPEPLVALAGGSEKQAAGASSTGPQGWGLRSGSSQFHRFVKGAGER